MKKTKFYIMTDYILIVFLIILLSAKCQDNHSKKINENFDTILSDDLFTLDYELYVKKSDSLPFTGYCIELKK